MVMADGTVCVLTYERDDKVVAFTTIVPADISIDGVCILPGTSEDEVYYTGMIGDGLCVPGQSTDYSSVDVVRYRLAPESEQRDVSTCALLDAHKVITGDLSVTTITGASHLEAQLVQVWADGQRRADVTISGGTAALGATYSRVVYGKSYTAGFKSAKLSYAAQLGSSVGQTKIIRAAGVILGKSCLDGLRVGKDASYTDPMPPYVDGALRTTNQFFEHYDADMMPVPADWNVDSRIYIEADSAEGPVTVKAVVLDVETHDGATARNK
jgi:hypothetical protein